MNWRLQQNYLSTNEPLLTIIRPKYFYIFNSSNMDQLFGDDEPKKQPRQRPNLRPADPERMKARGKRGRKKSPHTQPTVAPVENNGMPHLIKYWNESLKAQQDITIEQYVAFVYSHDQPIMQTFYQPEDDRGHIEYKLKLTEITPERMEQLTTQMKFRLNEGVGKKRPPEVDVKYRLSEGVGEAFYRIGVEDNGRPTGLNLQFMMESLKTLYKISQKLKADMIMIKLAQGIKGRVALVMIQKANVMGVQLEIRALLFGQSLHGKSTLLGVLKTGEMDDGRGKARQQVFTTQKQLVTGVTQSINHEVIVFDNSGKIVSQSALASWQSILNVSTKVLTIIDVGGHKKAQKQVVSSLCSFFPEYAIVVLSALHPKINSEPMHLATAFNLPMIIVITHIDVAKEQMIREAISDTKNTLKQLCPEKVPTIINNLESAILMSQLISNEPVIPIFPISNVTGENIDILKGFLNQLPSISDLKNNVGMPTQFLISEKFMVKHKTIVAGTVIKGNIYKKQKLLLGPDSKGNFKSVMAVDVNCLRIPVPSAKCGQTCTVHIIDPNDETMEFVDIRKGMVLIDQEAETKAAKEFSVEIRLLPRATQVSISNKYQPVVNTLTTRQQCQIIFLKQKQLNKEEEQFRELSLKKQKSRSISGRTSLKTSAMNSSLNLRHRASMNTLNLSESKTITKSTSHDESKQVRKIPSFELSVSSNLASSPLVTQSKITNLNTDTLVPTIQKPIKKMSRQLTDGLEEITEEKGRDRKRKEKQEILIVPNQTQTLRLRFKYTYEYLTVGQKIIINDGLLKAIGKVTDIYY